MLFHALTLPGPDGDVENAGGCMRTLMYWKITYGRCYSLYTTKYLVKFGGQIWLPILSPFARHGASAHVFNIRLPGP